MKPIIPNIGGIHPVAETGIPLTIPFAQSVPAGFPSPAADYMEDEIDFNQLLRPRPASTYVIRVQGNSMIEANIPDGALLIVDKSVKPANNQIIVAVIDGEFTVKRLVRNNTGIHLMPANPKFRPITITEGMDFIVWGTVTKVIIDAMKL